jgi:hypothetical protein
MAARLVKSKAPQPSDGERGVVLCVHASADQVKTWPDEWRDLQVLMDAWREDGIQILTLGTGRAFQAGAREWFGRTQWQEMRHRNLGGLTTARILLGWRGPRPPATAPKPSDRRNPLRPLGSFLEPSTKLSKWRREGTIEACWAPCRVGAKAFLVPWGPSDPWVEAPTCLLGKRDLSACDPPITYIQRPMTLKERGQLLDVREDWGVAIVPQMWAWDLGTAPPRCACWLSPQWR